MRLDSSQSIWPLAADRRPLAAAQARRAASSVPTNIAEGCGRYGDRELARFLAIAAGSATELEYLFILMRDLGYVEEKSVSLLIKQVVEIRKILAGFHKNLVAGR